MSLLLLRRIPVLTDDTHPPGRKDTGRCKEPAKTRQKQPVNFSFFFSGKKYSRVTSGGSCNEKYAGFLLPVYMANVEDLLMVNVSKEGQVFKCEICGLSLIHI